MFRSSSAPGCSTASCTTRRAAEQKAALGEELRGTNLQQGHSRLTAFAAYWRKKDAKLAARAWSEFTDGRAGYGQRQTFASKRIEAPAVLNPVDEGPGISTNSSAQWGLAGHRLPWRTREGCLK